MTEPNLFVPTFGKVFKRWFIVEKKKSIDADYKHGIVQVLT